MPSLNRTGTYRDRADVNALRILARSMVRELGKHGYGIRHIVVLANELIGLACESIRAGCMFDPRTAQTGDDGPGDAAEGGIPSASRPHVK